MSSHRFKRLVLRRFDLHLLRNCGYFNNGVDESSSSCKIGGSFELHNLILSVFARFGLADYYNDPGCYNLSLVKVAC